MSVLCIIILYFNVDCRSGARWVAEIEGNLQKAVSHCKSQKLEITPLCLLQNSYTESVPRVHISAC